MIVVVGFSCRMVEKSAFESSRVRIVMANGGSEAARTERMGEPTVPDA